MFLKKQNRDIKQKFWKDEKLLMVLLGEAFGLWFSQNWFSQKYFYWMCNCSLLEMLLVEKLPPAVYIACLTSAFKTQEENPEV